MKRFFAVVAVSLLTSCASGVNDRGARLIKPDLAVEQIGRTTYSGGGVTSRMDVGGAPVTFRIAIRNNSSEPIRLQRIELATVTQGAYTIDNAIKPFDVPIAPAQIAQVDMWAATTVQNSISGGQGPVTVKVVAYFESPAGKFREIYMRTVNDPLRSRGGKM